MAYKTIEDLRKHLTEAEAEARKQSDPNHPSLSYLKREGDRKRQADFHRGEATGYGLATEWLNDYLADHPQTPITQGVKNLCRNAWDWDYRTFCEKTGFNYEPDNEHAYSLQKFRSFAAAANALRRFDGERLKVLCTREEQS